MRLIVGMISVGLSGHPARCICVSEQLATPGRLRRFLNGLRRWSLRGFLLIALVNLGWANPGMIRTSLKATGGFFALPDVATRLTMAWLKFASSTKRAANS